MTQQIYLDHAATTPLAAAVLEAMAPFWNQSFANPSALHTAGRRVRRALEQARSTIAAILGVAPSNIIFTACGTESDNIALRGALWAARHSDRGNHLIISAIEHSAVLKTAVQLRDLMGFELTIVPVNEHGQVAVADVAAAIRPETTLISIMAANNEIGTLQPIDAIGEVAQAHGVLLHSDAVQATSILCQGQALRDRPIDLLSLSGHKFYGPRGIGVLYVRTGTQLLATTTGGGQEGGVRPGTESVALAVGLARALELVVEKGSAETKRLKDLRDRLISATLSALGDDIRLTGHPVERLANHAAFALRHFNANDLLMHLDMGGVAAGSGSACATGNPKPSRVLQAIGLDDSWAKGGLRFTLGRDTTQSDIDTTVALLQRIMPKLKRLAAYH